MYLQAAMFAIIHGASNTNNKRDPPFPGWRSGLLNLVWTWSGRFVGYWDKDDLWASNGKHIGRRRGLEIYAPNGRYIGELMHNGRLAVNKAKVGLSGSSFIPYGARAKQVNEPNQDSLPLYTGFDDFWVAAEL
jgi:hypothetical protein